MQRVTELQKKIYILGRNNKQFRLCHAVKENGVPCKCKAMSGEVFCNSHLLQGYGLFTLAVMAREAVSAPPASKYLREHDKENQNGTR